MRRFFNIISALALFVLSVVSCRAISSFINEDDVVAKVGRHKLYASELARFIPSGISSGDSTRLALQYINTWASDILFIDAAEKALSKEDLNVSDELADYKRSLLKYRYEQQYINQKLDTVVTPEQIKEYYDTHPDMFKLNIPIVKARFLRISKSSQYVEEMKKMMAYSEEESGYGDSLVYSPAISYLDFSTKWVSSVIVARECGTEASSMISGLHNGYYEKEDGNGNINIAYILDVRKIGEQGPIEYYNNQIKDILLSVRKRVLITGLEQDLLNKARSDGDIVIY